MSVLTYNGITLAYNSTTYFRQEAVYEEVGGVDRMLTRYDITCQSVINSNYLSSIASNLLVNGQPGTDNAALIMNAIREKLLKPRRALSFTFNGVDIIPISPATFKRLDAKNGPQPRYCDIIQFNNSTFMISFAITAHYWENNVVNISANPVVKNNPGNPVLFNRWSERVSIDNCNYTTRTRQGKYGIRSDNVEGKTADSFRSDMAVLGVPEGFLRHSSDYAISPDGLILEYSIVDKEVYKKPPVPAFEAEGEYVETSSRGDGKRFGEVRVRLKGDKGAIATQSNLVYVCMAVCSTKLDIVGAPLTVEALQDPREKGVLEYAALKVGMYENWVECHMRAMIPPLNRKLKGVVIGRKAQVFTPLSDGQQAVLKPAYLDRGTASLLLQTASYYDPNLKQKLGAATPQDLVFPNNQFTPNASQRNRMAGPRPGEGGTTAEVGQDQV